MSAHKTAARRAAKARAAALAPFEAMTDRELTRALHTNDFRQRQSAHTVIMDRINERNIEITYDGYADAIEAAHAAFARAAA